MSASSWPIVSLEEVATLQRGYDLPVYMRKEGEYPVYAANGLHGSHNEKKVTGPGIVTGRSGTIGKVHYVEHDYWPLNTALYVKNFHGNDPKWIYYMLKNFHLERFAQGAGVPTLNRNLVHGEKIALPPIHKQKRIASILDMADVIHHKRQQAIQLADEFLRAVFFDMFGGTKNIPREKLGKVSVSIEYGLSASAKTSGNGPQLLRITDIQDDSVDWLSVPVCDCSKKNEEKYRLISGDIVFARTGATTGKSFLVLDPPDRSVFASYLIRVRPAEMLDEVYLSHFFKSSDYWNQVKSLSQGAAQPGINGSKLKEMSVPVPDINKQLEFRKIVEKVHKVYATIKASKNKSNNLIDSLSQQAFSGTI